MLKQLSSVVTGISQFMNFINFDIVCQSVVSYCFLWHMFTWSIYQVGVLSLAREPGSLRKEVEVLPCRAGKWNFICFILFERREGCAVHLTVRLLSNITRSATRIRWWLTHSSNLIFMKAESHRQVGNRHYLTVTNARKLLGFILHHQHVYSFIAFQNSQKSNI